MKGRLSSNKWFVAKDIATHSSYFAERTIDGERQYKEVRSHCLACAKTDVMTRYGGLVDTRGWHLQGTCGSFMRILAEVNKED